MPRQHMLVCNPCVIEASGNGLAELRRRVTVAVSEAVRQCSIRSQQARLLMLLCQQVKEVSPQICVFK